VSADAIKLVIPHDRPFYGIARLVVGGLAARHDMPLEQLEDLQLALDSVLENESYAAGEDVTLELQMANDAVRVVVGPLDARELAPDLERESDGDGIGLRRLLGTVVERAELEERDGATWLRLEKRK
jgi:hypothetical protein